MFFAIKDKSGATALDIACEQNDDAVAAVLFGKLSVKGLTLAEAYASCLKRMPSEGDTSKLLAACKKYEAEVEKARQAAKTAQEKQKDPAELQRITALNEQFRVADCKRYFKTHYTNAFQLSVNEAAARKILDLPDRDAGVPFNPADSATAKVGAKKLFLQFHSDKSTTSAVVKAQACSDMWTRVSKISKNEDTQAVLMKEFLRPQKPRSDADDGVFIDDPHPPTQSCFFAVTGA
jgi:hypothetical protein